MPPLAIAGLVLKTALVPLAGGMVVRAIAPSGADRIAKAVGRVATVLLVIGAMAILPAAAPAMLRLIGGGTLLAMIAFVGVGLFAGHRLGGPEPNDRTVLALSTASRHPAIALAVAKANFPEEPFLGAAILLYLIVGLLVGAIYVSRRSTAVAAPSPSPL
jgi:BASS family bile acid:Na+ symporter